MDSDQASAMSREMFDRHSAAMCRIINSRTGQTSGTGFLCRVDVGDRVMYGIATSTWAMVDLTRANRLSTRYALRYKFQPARYTAVFDKAPQLGEVNMMDFSFSMACERGTGTNFATVPEDTVMRWTTEPHCLRFEDAVDDDETVNEVCVTGRQVFSLYHRDGGGQLACGGGNIGDVQDNFLSHNINMSNDGAACGAPIIDCRTEKVIAIHTGDVGRVGLKRASSGYQGGAVKMMPFISFVRKCGGSCCCSCCVPVTRSKNKGGIGPSDSQLDHVSVRYAHAGTTKI